jgi:D-tyrosyl-tRNA(Tyr) deacylase
VKAVVQRVARAAVRVNGECVGQIGPGLLILVGVRNGDAESDAKWLAEKCVNLRIFENETGKFDRSVLDVRGGLLAVSQFTLLGNCARGRRPDFTDAARPREAEPLFRRFLDFLRESGLAVEAGVFQARMDVELINDGPVTVIVDSTA